MTRIAIIDSQITGISGDMLLSSLIDAGANKDKVINAIIACQNFVKGSKIIDANFYKTISHGFSATRFQLEYKDSTSHRRGIEMYRSLALCCDSLDLEQRATTFVLESLKTIIASEAF
ncbi:MAG TPA: nickel insertion protein, partial [Nitrososphaeraceae archaeon]